MYINESSSSYYHFSRNVLEYKKTRDSWIQNIALFALPPLAYECYLN